MRINRFLALATGISRREADKLIRGSRVFINDIVAQLGDQVTSNDKISLGRKQLLAPSSSTTILVNKPIGYVCSRKGQGNKTIYDLLPPELRVLKPVGRLDKDSSGLLIMTDDGQLANGLMHPKYKKNKIYEVTLDRALNSTAEISLEAGIKLSDGISHLFISHNGINRKELRVTMHEGRNRQIRRTFAALGYTVKKLHRTNFGDFELKDLLSGSYKILSSHN